MKRNILKNILKHLKNLRKKYIDPSVECHSKFTSVFCNREALLKVMQFKAHWVMLVTNSYTNSKLWFLYISFVFKYFLRHGRKPDLPQLLVKSVPQAIFLAWEGKLVIHGSPWAPVMMVRAPWRKLQQFSSGKVHND